MAASKTKKPGNGVKRRRPQQRALATRDAILKAALVEFGDRDFAAVSTRSVAERAKVQHPLLNYHFKNKEGLWRAVLETTAGAFLSQINKRLIALRGIDDVTKLRMIQEDFVRFAAAHPHYHLLMSREAGTTQHLKWLIKEYVRPYFDVTTRLIKSAQRSGHYVQGDPKHLQYLFIGAATRIFTLAAEVKIITRRSPFSRTMIDDHVQAVLDLFFIDRRERPGQIPVHGRDRTKNSSKR